jgi:hypothetical protein
MKLIPIFMFASIALTAPAISHAQVAGSTLIGVSVTEMRDVNVKSWGSPYLTTRMNGSDQSTTSSSRLTRRFPTPSSTQAASPD